MKTFGAGSHLSGVPLFPLPNVVLFPRAVLPLHIFEERYKAMMKDALEGDRLIAMALLQEGWEKNYHGRPPIQDIVCVGEILTWEKLPDGRYNLLLQGKARGRVMREQFVDPYRAVEVEVLGETGAMEIDLEEQRCRLKELFEGRVLAAMPVARTFQDLIAGPVPTADLADLAAFNLLEDVDVKQELLAETNVRRRVGRTIEALEEWAAHLNPALHGFPTDPGLN